MAYVALLVSEQRLKQWTGLDENVRTEEITPWIISAQDVYMQTALGTSFYNRLKEGVIANDLNANEQELLNDYIAPCLMQYALYLMMPTIKYKIVEKGIVSGTSEETQPTTLEELKYLRQSVLDLAEFYDQRLREYLRQAVSGTFPLYTSPTANDGMNPTRSTPYFAGLVTNINNYNKRYDVWCSECAQNGCTCK